jgi:hypothetical protein
MQKRLNIKNAEAVAIAEKLAKDMGLTKTQVVLQALRNRKQSLIDQGVVFGIDEEKTSEKMQ